VTEREGIQCGFFSSASLYLSNVRIIQPYFLVTCITSEKEREDETRYGLSIS
jgi:hypothetical protein